MRSAILAASLTLVACGSDDGDGGELTCAAVPQCLTDALAALQACVASPTLTLGTPTNNSGVVDNLRCTSTDLTVAFSTFSYNPTGTVPLPSTTTLQVAGATCATIKRATGTTTNGGGDTQSFDISTIERPGADPVSVNRYANGDIGVQCGGSPSSELVAPASALTGCATKYASPIVFRDDAITMMGVHMIDTTKALSVLFTCTR